MPFLTSSLGGQAAYPSRWLILEVRRGGATIFSRRLINELALISCRNNWTFAGLGLMVTGHHHLVPLYNNDLLLRLVGIRTEWRDLLTLPRCVQYPWLQIGSLLLDCRYLDFDTCLIVQLPPRHWNILAVSLADESIL
jgi:hypothetical protein